MAKQFTCFLSKKLSANLLLCVLRLEYAPFEAHHMRNLLLPLSLVLALSCNSDSDDVSNEEKIQLCAASVLVCQQDPEEGGARDFCLTTFASRICTGFIF